MKMGRIYLHSAGSDFANTQRLPPAEFLGRPIEQQTGALTLFTCGCGKHGLVRIPRASWMRSIPFLRLYQCSLCGTRVLRPRIRQRHAYGAVYLPPAVRNRRVAAIVHAGSPGRARPHARMIQSNT